MFKTTDKNNKNIILKIANKNPRKILREIKLIKILCSSSKFFKNSIPDILEHGYFKKGLFKNKGYYKQKYIPGTHRDKAGCLFRLRDKLNQYFCVYDLWFMSAKEIMNLLPKEFSTFIPRNLR